MDREIEDSRVKAEAKSNYSSEHLMCRAPLWGIAGFIGCAYFAWISFSHVARREYDWPHDAWTATTYIVWILLLCALAVDTRCLRERVFFALLVLNFVIGFGLTLWHTVTSANVRGVRIATGTLWTLAALVSLTTLGKKGRSEVIGS
jgi:hypothetical protein